MTDRALRLIQESIAALQKLAPGNTSLDQFWQTIGGVEARLQIIEEEIAPKLNWTPKSVAELEKEYDRIRTPDEILARNRAKGLRADDLKENYDIMRKL